MNHWIIIVMYLYVGEGKGRVSREGKRETRARKVITRRERRQKGRRETKRVGVEIKFSLM